jgi:hypothetical protein
MWTVGIYTMWLRAHFTMAHRKRNSNDISGEHRAVLELAFAMQMELYLYDSDLSVLKEKDLRQRVNNELNGGAISYSYANAEMKMYSMRKQLKNWLKNEKWWFTAIFVTSLLLGAVWTGSNEGMILTFGMCAVWLGLFLAICLGTTNGSRILIVLFWSVVSAIAVGSLLGSFS